MLLLNKGSGIMNFLGSKTIETERLILKAQSHEDEKRLWEILMIPEVNKYYLTVPKKFKDKLNDWDKQKAFYDNDTLHANDPDIFKWSIFLKENNECIGRISCQESSEEKENSAIRDVGWYLDPIHQGKGYGSEAAIAMIKYMFDEVDIEKIITGAAIENPASWKIMEKLGFERQNNTLEGFVK